MANDRSSAATTTQLEHQRLISLINSMGDGVIAVDQSIRIVLYNASALNIMDVNATIQNEPLRYAVKLFDKDDKPIDVEDLIKKTKIPISNRDYRLHYTDGSVINLYLSIAPVHLGYGQSGQRGFVLVLRDITHEKSLEEERDEFISVVSHELRTPITIAEGNISNAALIVEKSGSITEVKKALSAAHDQVIFLSQLINDLATLSRAERGKLTVDISPTNVHTLVQDLVTTYKPEALAKRIDILAEIDPSLQLIHSSELYIKEILQNFITNAVKYTQKGQIIVEAKSLKDAVEFSVTDSGIGISKQDQEKVFQKFFRSEDYRTRQTKGTGLGLYVTKKLANLLSGKISLKSELNKGSTFTIVIPNLKDVK